MKLGFASMALAAIGLLAVLSSGSLYVIGYKAVAIARGMAATVFTIGIEGMVGAALSILKGALS